ncbi:TlpA family protein disulfide reductase [bacterium]|nr:TlpA family protein disulfide reductase [bacterium]
MKRLIFLLIALLLPILLNGETDFVSTFPDFTLKNIDGNPITLSEETQKGPVIVTFWATWCKPCIKELRKLNEMKEFLDKHNVAVFPINEDGARTRAKVKPFAIKQGWKFKVLMDPRNKVKTLAGVAELPEFFIICEGNEILYRHSGYKPGDEAEYKEKIEAFFPVLEDDDKQENAIE